MDNQPWEKSDNLDDVKKFLGKVMRYWYLILGVLIIAVITAFAFNRYTKQVYVISASFITKKFDQNRTGQLGGVIEENIFRQNIEVSQEIPFLKSQDKIEETLKRLDFGISYFVKGRFKTTEIYGPFNFKVILDSTSTSIPYGHPIFIHSKNGKYTLETENADLQKELTGKEFFFGRPYDLKGWKFTINQNTTASRGTDYYYFIINNPRSLLSEYRNKLSINWAQKGSAILNVNMQSDMPDKDLAFLRTYLNVVIEKGLQDKNEHLTNTIDFINHYIVGIADTLLSYQNRIDNYKLANRELINGPSIMYERLNELDRLEADVLLTNKYYDYITEYIQEKRDSVVFAPNVIGLNAPLLTDLVNDYIAAKWEEKNKRNEFNYLNPVVNKKSDAFERIEQNIYESINELKAANQMKLEQINERARFYYGTIKGSQAESREFSELERMRAIYNNLFNELISRRTNAHITRASTTSDYQIVTSPGYSSLPIKPDKNKNYLIAIILGLGLPIGFIYLKDMFNNKIITKDDLLKGTNIPLIGNIGHSIAKSNIVIKEKPKSVVSESFRSIRANLQYLNKGEKNHTVCLITSSISNEGKTFCSINLAYAFALTGKKTVLLGADMRKPTLSKNFDMRDYKGLSNYLAGFVSIEKVIYPIEDQMLFIIPGGDVPPNPAELITSDKMGGMMEYLRKNFEVVIIDTPPIGLVSDSIELLKYTDINLLVVRQGRTLKDSLAAITDMYTSGKISNMGILFNDVDFSKMNYGYTSGYGYGYGNGGYGYYDEDEDKLKWWQRMGVKG